ncbi:type II toxin-antitoxin system RatA family toxin [Aliiroseovarius crassostreae]|uniref:type II toxin-antitoxin system RatA family toxin n=1 Tax=Aliiroseovarius crassostreae TaxID=154981 RepID=UPI003C7AF1E9
MPTHGEKRVLPYTPMQMYELVADVEKYPEFLPWNAAARVRKRTAQPDGTEVIEADLVISFKVFRERFGSRARLDPITPRLDMEYLDGPFKYLRSHWQFHPHEEGCEVEFFVDFEFKSVVLQKVIGLVFNEAMQRIVRAFELRAQDLYGASGT